MYIGNPSLSGHPLPKVCPGDQPIQNPIKWHENDMTMMDLYLGLTGGFLVGLWIIFLWPFVQKDLEVHLFQPI
jgi:hypothetical protein